MPIFSQDESLFIRNLPEKKRIQLTGTLFLYIFRGNKQEEIRELLDKQDIPFDFLTWRRSLHQNGVLLRDAKIWMYGVACGESYRFSDFDLTRADRVFMAYAQQYRPLEQRLKLLCKEEQRDPLGLKAFDQYAGEVLASEDLQTYVRKYLRRKMGFLVASYNVSFDELESDLMSWAHYALLKSYPRFDDVGHGLAIAKTTVKRRGVNLMKTLTSQRNNSLITREDGKCERTSVSMSTIGDLTGQFLTADGTFIHRSFLVVGIDGVNSSVNSVGWETQRAIKELLTSPMLNSLHKEFLNLMLGEQHEGFSEFLGEPNEEYIERSDYETYMHKICRYMGLTTDMVTSFLASLKPHLGGVAQSTL